MAPQSLVKDLKRKRGDEETTAPTTAPYKQRVLVLSSRGITQRQRHLMSDLTSLLPHSKKDAKLDSKHQLPLLNELCDLSNCNNALFFEARRKHGDLYLWAAKAPNGPSVRFHVLNIHTMDELKMTGNCLKGSRPVVVFDKQFDESPHLALIKEVLMNVSTPLSPPWLPSITGLLHGLCVMRICMGKGLTNLVRSPLATLDLRRSEDCSPGKALRGPRYQLLNRRWQNLVPQLPGKHDCCCAAGPALPRA